MEGWSVTMFYSVMIILAEFLREAQLITVIQQMYACNVIYSCMKF